MNFVFSYSSKKIKPMFSILSSWIFKLIGWKITGELPDSRKYIILIGPHTSNWDFILTVLTKGILKLKGNFVGKHTLFESPIGFYFRWLGGYPVYRDRANNYVEQVAALFKSEDSFIFVLAPEGTRKKVKALKSGFYYIAAAANVPVVAVGLDYAKGEAQIQPAYTVTTKEETLAHFTAYYRTVTAKYPKDAL